MHKAAVTLSSRWQNSVVFRLAALMFIIVAFIAVTQASVGLQIYRLNKTQDAFLERSVPLLDKSQQFARLTTTTLSQTARLDEYLSAPDLLDLRTNYLESKAKSELILAEIADLSLNSDNISGFRASRDRFSTINEQLFDNQLNQRAQQDERAAQKAKILEIADQFQDLIGQMLVHSTTQILSIPEELKEGQPLEDDTLDSLLTFAGENEVLLTLKTHIVDVDNMMRGLQAEQDTAFYINRLRFRVRSISQSLVLLRDTQERQRLAIYASDINTALTAPGGYIEAAQKMQTSRDRFVLLKRQQIEAVREVDSEVEKIVAAAAITFENDIKVADRSTEIILWIGIATTAIVVLGMFFLNRFVVQKQISQRFTTLTDDVLEISKGNYKHPVRVKGTDELGDIAHALNVFKDQAAELERSNAELERFAYVAAHDLRSPLDAIQDLAKWTLEDAADTLDPDSKHNLELLIKRTARLSTLQKDLLTYAQAGTQKPEMTEFSLLGEIENISDMIDPNDHFKITLINDPGYIKSYQTPISQILINLITNAIKHHDRQEGNISVTFTESPGMLRFDVEDDGPGIEKKYQTQIFELFRTLKSRDRVEGSGLGLALVSKLVTRFGGTVEVHSDAPEKRGTRFSFTIPQNDKTTR